MSWKPGIISRVFQLAASILIYLLLALVNVAEHADVLRFVCALSGANMILTAYLLYKG